jgi:exosortase D (VPLPA-CTERM-specific)
MLIPLISLGIAWFKRAEVARVANGGSWAGPVVVAASLLLATAGQMATIYVIVHVSIVLTVIGLSLCFLGARATKVLWFPLLFLFFMIPLPDFLQVQLSARMQLVSSALGVGLIRLFGITVLLDGNVIDLGDFKMQVVEACNGLRYMFPLMSFGMLVAYLYNGPFWQRTVLFLSTIPITILMNSARIGLIGIVYDAYGIDTANGALHDFQGWAIFIVCLLILLIEVRLLTYLLPRRRSIFDHFSVASGKA